MCVSDVNILHQVSFLASVAQQDPLAHFASLTCCIQNTMIFIFLFGAVVTVTGRYQLELEKNRRKDFTIMEKAPTLRPA